MKTFIASLILVSTMFSGAVSASENSFGGAVPFKSTSDKAENVQHLLDGSSIEYQYQNGWAIHMELYNGLLKYEWIAGPMKGNSNKDLPYRSRKIGSKQYMINWYEQSKPDFVTLVFNFDTNVIYSSGLIMIGTDKQFSIFDGGIIDQSTLVEK